MILPCAGEPLYLLLEQNAPSAISVTPSGMVRPPEKEQSVNARSPIVRKPFPSVRVPFDITLPKKAHLSIVVTLSGITRSPVRLVQFINAFSPITCTFFPILTVVQDKLENDSFPIFVIESPITTVLISLRYALHGRGSGSPHWNTQSFIAPLPEMVSVPVLLSNDQ